MEVANTLAYNDTVTTIAIKSFIVQARCNEINLKINDFCNLNLP
jgi:hypothetical protein